MADRDDLIRERAARATGGCSDDHWYSAEEDLAEAEDAAKAKKERSEQPAKKK